MRKYFRQRFDHLLKAAGIRRPSPRAASGDPCSRYETLLSEYADGHLDTRKAQLVEGHLNACAACRATLAATRLVGQSMGMRSTPMFTGDMSSRLRTAIAGERARKPAPPARILTPYRAGVAGLAFAAASMVIGAFIMRGGPAVMPTASNNAPATSGAPATPAISGHSLKNRAPGAKVAFGVRPLASPTGPPSDFDTSDATPGSADMQPGSISHVALPTSLSGTGDAAIRPRPASTPTTTASLRWPVSTAPAQPAPRAVTSAPTYEPPASPAAKSNPSEVAEMPAPRPSSPADDTPKPSAPVEVASAAPTEAAPTPASYTIGAGDQDSVNSVIKRAARRHSLAGSSISGRVSASGTGPESDTVSVTYAHY